MKNSTHVNGQREERQNAENRAEENLKELHAVWWFFYESVPRVSNVFFAEESNFIYDSSNYK